MFFLLPCGKICKKKIGMFRKCRLVYKSRAVRQAFEGSPFFVWIIFFHKEAGRTKFFQFNYKKPQQHDGFLFFLSIFAALKKKLPWQSSKKDTFSSLFEKNVSEPDFEQTAYAVSPLPPPHSPHISLCTQLLNIPLLFKFNHFSGKCFCYQQSF